MRRNWLVIILGVVLMVGSFAAVLYLGQTLNPQPTMVVVVLRDLEPGDVLGDSNGDGVYNDQDDFQLILAGTSLGVVDSDPTIVASFVTADEVGNYLGRTVLVPLFANQPLLESSLGGLGEADTLAAQLEADLVAMVVPVSEETAPSSIRVGNYVDLVVGVVNSPAVALAVGTPPPTADPLFAAPLQPQAGPTSALVYAPLAKTIVTNARVLEVVREQTAQTATDANGQPVQVTVNGPVTALVLAIPREAQEVVKFALGTGNVSVSLVAQVATSGVDSGTRRPTLGMTWDDLVALIEMDRQQRLAEGLPADNGGAGMNLYREDNGENAPASSAAAPIPGTPTAVPTATPTARP